MQRLIMDPSKLKISKPGYDVTTAATDKLIFDSSQVTYNGVYLSGVALYSSSVQTLTDTSEYTHTYTINFGKTFAAPPSIRVMFRDPYFGGVTPFYMCDGPASAAYQANVTSNYTISTTSLIVKIVVSGNQSVFPSHMDVCYTIFHS